MYHLVKYTCFAGLALLLLGCENRRQVEGQEPVKEQQEPTVNTAGHADTAKVVKTGETTDEKLEELRGWMNEQANKGDTAIRKEWPQIREKLRARNAELEQNFDSLSDKGKAEYRQLQKNYKQWEARQERRQQQPLDQKKVTQWKSTLLGEYSTVDDISAATIREAYLTFMGVVRTKRKGWTQDDWDYVDYIYSLLNQRRRQIEGEISMADNIKIRTLQAEYLTLEGTADTKSMLEGTK
ncbi:hypothetical protein [Pontibacter liquoris]|uniref:hypothetical protein n=1 Tax=Pontibacter liquoris TaxID=2905677 RepID=UPI001FA74F4E|nr:hypothetical protein [Pontibacter liquoris]